MRGNEQMLIDKHWILVQFYCTICVSHPTLNAGNSLDSTILAWPLMHIWFRMRS